MGSLGKEESSLETEENVGRVGEEGTSQENDKNGGDGVLEAAFGDNVLEFGGQERSTQETTTCSLIRDPDNISTPSSTAKPMGSFEAIMKANASMQKKIAMEHEIDELFAGAEEQQLTLFMENYRTTLILRGRSLFLDAMNG